MNLKEYMKNNYRNPNPYILEDLGASEDLIEYLRTTPWNSNFNMFETLGYKSDKDDKNWKVHWSGTVDTIADSGDPYAWGSVDGMEEFDVAEARITFNNTVYICNKKTDIKTEQIYYGEFTPTEDIPFSLFATSSETHSSGLATLSEGTYTLKVEIPVI